MKGIKSNSKIAVFTILLISLIPHTIGAYNTRTINPYSILIGSSAVDHKENIYTINPASIGFMQSVMLFQNFNLNKSRDNIIYSQNLAFKLSSAHSFLLGYSVVDKNKIVKENSMFRLNYALNLGDFLYIGANFNYRDKHYRKFHKKNLKTDLGLIFSLKPDNTLKFINIGAYSLDANLEKISLDLPNTNFGQYAALGFALGMNILNNTDMVLSADIDQVRDNKILSNKEKIYKYGIQLNFKDTSFLSSLKAAIEYYGRDSIENPSSGYSAGAAFNLSLFKLTYAYKHNSFSGENNQYLSAAFQLSDNNKKEVSTKKETEEINEEKIENNNRIKMTCFQEDGNCKILFHGDRSDLVLWKIYIVEKKGEMLLNIQSENELPEHIVWNLKDDNGKMIRDGVYTINFVYIKDSEDMQLYDEHKEVKIANSRANRINMTYYQEDGNYKILFHGDSSKINYWRFNITDIKGKTLKDFGSTDSLPEYTIWDRKDFNGKEIPKGTYKLKLFIVKGENMEEIYEEEKEMKVN